MTDKPISFQSIEKQLSRLTSTTNNIIIPKEMQDFKLVGAVELPPIFEVPSNNHGYMVMLAQ